MYKKIIVHAYKTILPLLKALPILNYKFIRRLIYDISQNEIILSNGPKEKFIVFAKHCHLSRDLFLTNQPTDFGKLLQVKKILDQEKIKFQLLIDVGANIGSICVPACNRGVVNKAIAIEPDPKNFKLLSINVSLNSLTEKIKLIHSAVGPESESEILLHLSNDNSGDNRVFIDKKYDAALFRETIKVGSTSLDEIIQENINENSLIWMDIQGYEGYALKGSSEILRHRKPLVLEFWPSGMIKSKSYKILKDCLLQNSYKRFYNLDDVNDVPFELNNQELDKLFENYRANERFTDILVL